MEQTAKIIRLPQVRALVGLGKTAIYDKIKEGQFPKPLKLGTNASGWIEGEIIEWKKKQPTADCLLGVEAVIETVGLGKTAIYEQIKQGLFPKPVKGNGYFGWLIADVQGWINKQVQAQRGGVAA